jgi:transcriptional regulator with XRE-family HTH domain
MAPRSDPQVALGQAIRQTRLARGLSQEQVAHGADLHPTWLSHIEGGRNPAWGTVRRIASALGVEVSEVARLAEEIEAENTSVSGSGGANPRGSTRS